jgi:leucyl-tRNA synthetase
MEKPRYDHKKIEKKWQKIWKDHKTFKSVVDHKKPKYYILDMFPYPSGAGLHVGHVTGYTGTDILARYKRQQGFNVLHPMGWDSFGLPAEQYAIRTGTHPAVTTRENIATYKRQINSLGFSYDWDREIATSDPSYYKWTQWIFTKLYKKNLAYEASLFVNFCPALGTVLANEEVENGKAKEGGYPVERRPLKQWVLKITQYADRLVEDLNEADWPENIKRLQINWIGKSEGAKVLFTEEKTEESIWVFTTRPDTLFGVSYLVLSPEHPLVEKITHQDKLKEVKDYQKEIASKSDLERTDLAKEKTGVFTGSYALHPITGKKIPVWISDYVLMGYGTGAIMAVPAHDERDFAFAKQFNLPIIPVFSPIGVDTDGKEVDNETKRAVLAGEKCWTEDGLSINCQYKDLQLNNLSSPEVMEKIVAFLIKHKKGEKAISYKLRDWLFSRQRYWGEPIPILHFEDGTERALDLDELPLIPPDLKDFKPAGSGESPLIKCPEWVNYLDPKTGKQAKRATNTMPQWAGSCWYYLRYCDPTNTEEAWSREAEKYWMNVDMYVGGAEHAVLHLLYARFWHKVLYDCGVVSTKEPFQTYRYQGVVTAPSYKRPGGGYVDPNNVFEKNGKYFDKETKEELEYQIEKMSKSKLNGVSPDEIIEEFGADSLRLYEMFMGPFEKEKVWNTNAVNGCYRFLNRVFDLCYSEKVTEKDTLEGLKLSHRLVKQVTKDIETMQFNTAVAHMMEFINDFSSLEHYPKKSLKMLVQMVYPFAPHIAEELWEYFGERSLTTEPLPKVEEKYLIDEIITYVVQVNGKLRGRFELEKDLSEESLLEFVKKQEQVKKHIENGIEKVIYVPNKLLNIVTKS